MSIPCFHWEGSDVLEGVGDEQGDSGGNGDSSGEWKSNNVLGTSLEFGKKWAGVEVKDGFGENASFVIDGFDFHTILKGFEVEFFKEGSFWGFDFFILGADLEVLGDLDLSFNDFGGNVEGVEEVNLWGVKTSGSSGDGKIDGWDDTDSGFSWDFVGFDFVSEFVDWGVTENECDFLLKEGNESLKFWEFATELLLEMSELFLVNAVDSHLDDFLDEGLNQWGCTFFEITSSLFKGLRSLRICWIWLEPTLVKVVRIICL